jgi:hypothetical protein
MSKMRSLLIIVWLAVTLPFTYGGCVMVFQSGDVNQQPDKQQSDNGDPSFRFVGATKQAVIDPATAVDLAGGALAAGLSESQPAVAATGASVGQADMDSLRSLRLPLTLGRALQMIDLRPAGSGLPRPAARTRRGTLTGSCGGWMDYTIQLDDMIGEFDGNLSFRDYCEPGLTLSGEVLADGSFDPSSGKPVTATFQFDSLTDHPMTLDGEMSLDFSDQPILATIECHAQDGDSGRVYWMKDFSVNLFETPGRAEAEAFGRFYHPDYGYVTVSTNVPFVLDDGDEWPAAGELLIDGLDGAQAKLTALGHQLYTVEADIDGDGVFDWSSDKRTWPLR